MGSPRGCKPPPRGPEPALVEYIYSRRVPAELTAGRDVEPPFRATGLGRENRGRSPVCANVPYGFRLGGVLRGGATARVERHERYAVSGVACRCNQHRSEFVAGDQVAQCCSVPEIVEGVEFPALGVSVQIGDDAPVGRCTIKGDHKARRPGARLGLEGVPQKCPHYRHH